MIQVAKIIIIDQDGKYLLLKRSDHPSFPNDSDLPGGTIEARENLLHGLLREVLEETGIVLKPDKITHQYTGDSYQAGYTYNLYIARVKQHSNVTISWEHASYEWVSREEFLKRSHSALDTYMHMAHDVMVRNSMIM